TRLRFEIKRLKPQLPIVMVSSDDAIPEPALNVVDAFVSKNEAPHCLLPVITRICGEKSLRVPRNKNCGLSIAVLEVSWDGEPLTSDGIFVPPTVASSRRSDHLWGDSEQKFLTLRQRLPFNRLVRVKKQRILSPRGLVYERKFHAEPVPHRLDCEARGRSAREKVQLRTPRRCDRSLRGKPSVRCAPPSARGRVAADK